MVGCRCYLPAELRPYRCNQHALPYQPARSGHRPPGGPAAAHSMISFQLPYLGSLPVHCCTLPCLADES